MKRPKTNWFHVHNHPESVLDQTRVSEASGIALQHLKPDEPNVSGHSKYYESTYPYGLQYRPKPHLRFNKEFQDALDKICHHAHSDDIDLDDATTRKKPSCRQPGHWGPIQQQLKNLCLDTKRQANIQSALTEAVKKTRPRPRLNASTSTEDLKPDLATMQEKLHELHKMFAVFNEAVNINKTRVEPLHWCLTICLQGPSPYSPLLKSRSYTFHW